MINDNVDDKAVKTFFLVCGSSTWLTFRLYSRRNMVEKDLEHNQSPLDYCSNQSGGSIADSDSLENGCFTVVHPCAASEMRLNYLFLHPSGDDLSPLPLKISKTLLEGPAADLRSIIIDKLEAEGITVKLGDIRFWQVRQVSCQ